MAFVVAASAAYPMLTGTVIPDSRPGFPGDHVTVPRFWYDMADFVNKESAGKVLVLPLDDYYQMPTNWGYYGVDDLPRQFFTRPVLQQYPGAYWGNPTRVDQLLRQVQDGLLNRKSANVSSALRTLGVDTVVLRSDLDTTSPGRSFVNPATVGAAITDEPTLKPVFASGALKAYQVQRPLGMLYTVKSSGENAGNVAGPATVDTPVELEGFTSIGDCQGDLGAKANGQISVKRTSTDPVVFELRSRSGQACVAGTGSIVSPSRDLRVQFDYQPVTGQPLRYCLLELPASTCALAGSLPVGDRSQLSRFDTVATLRPDTNSVQLFFYVSAKPSGPGPRDTLVRVSNPVMFSRDLAPPLAPATADGSNIESWSQKRGSKYEVVLRPSPDEQTLVLTETFSPQWRLKGNGASGARHQSVTGYANGWVIPPHSEPLHLTIEYSNQRLVTAGAAVTLLTILGLVFGVPAYRYVRRRRRGAGQPPAPPATPDVEVDTAQDLDSVVVR
jgi:hypothetical protein